MIGRPTERRGFPGGLRAQLLVGLCILVALAFGLVVVVVAERSLGRRPAGASADHLAHPGSGRSASGGGDSTASADRAGDPDTLLVWYLGLDALFILLVGYAFLTYIVMRPLRAIGVATRRAADGDLASPITILPHNEFGEIGRQFNQMLDELSQNRRQLERRLEELDAANQQLRQTQDSLIRSEKLASVGQLAAGVAHEVGNPLAAISGYLDLLADDPLDTDTTREIVERSQAEVDRIQRIIRDLLDYSREQPDPTVSPVALDQCIDEAISLVAAQPRSRDIQLTVDLPNELPAVLGVRSQIVQTLVNLLINAVDAINSDGVTGEVTIRAAAPPKGGVVVVVRDDGPGISHQHLERVFDPFFTTKDPGDGTGLGLAICLRMMRRFGGDLRARDTNGDGASFELTFETAAAASID